MDNDKSQYNQHENNETERFNISNDYDQKNQQIFNDEKRIDKKETNFKSYIKRQPFEK